MRNWVTCSLGWLVRLCNTLCFITIIAGLSTIIPREGKTIIGLEYVKESNK